MSETPTTAPKPAAPTTPASATPAEDEGKPLGEAGQKALKAEREARAAAEKSAAELKAKLDKIEAANLSDIERANKAAQDAQDAAAKASAEALRYKYAAKHGISDEDAERFLTGSDEATVAAQAERLAEIATPAAGTPPAPAKPRLAPDPSQGGAGAPPALNSDELEDALKRKLGISA